MQTSNACTTLVSTVPESHRVLRFPDICDAAAVGVALCHFDGRILEGNAVLARLLGCKQAELAGLDPWKYNEDDSPAIRSLTALLRGERGSFALEMPCCRRDASGFRGRVKVSLARNARHDPAFLVVLLENVTESTRIAQQLHQAEKMETIGRLTIGIARDFNNLLTVFLAYCDLLLAKFDSSDPLRRNFEEMHPSESSACKDDGAHSRSQNPPNFESTNNPITRSPESGDQP